jgi:hypothetical protein
LILLMQRQHIEEEELRLRHYMELEKFQKGIGEYKLWVCVCQGNENSTSAFNGLAPEQISAAGDSVNSTWSQQSSPSIGMGQPQPQQVMMTPIMSAQNPNIHYVQQQPQQPQMPMMYQNQPPQQQQQMMNVTSPQQMMKNDCDMQQQQQQQQQQQPQQPQYQQMPTSLSNTHSGGPTANH